MASIRHAGFFRDAVDVTSEEGANEKATRQKAAFSLRENSSNGSVFTVKTFWRNLMSRKSGVSRNF